MNKNRECMGAAPINLLDYWESHGIRKKLFHDYLESAVFMN